MSDGAPGHMLPPIAILRERDWGKDVTAIARDEWERVQDLEMIESLRPSEDAGYIMAVIDLYRFRRAIGNISHRSYLQRVSFNEDQARIIMQGRRYEADLAQALEYFVEQGSRIIVLGPEYIGELEKDASADARPQEVDPRRSTFYVHLEGETGPGPDGGQLDGFIIDYDPEELHGNVEILVTPLSRSQLPAGALASIECMIELSFVDAESTISQALLQRVSMVREGLDLESVESEAKAEEIEDVSPKAKRHSEIMQKANEELRAGHIQTTRAYLEIVEENAERWGRLIGGALRCVTGQGPVGLAGYAPGAPEDLVAKAMKGGTGARKVHQKLNAAGYPPVVRYEMGNVAPAVDAADKTPQKSAQAPDTTAMTVIAAPAIAPRVDRRKARRLEKQASRDAAKARVATKPAEERAKAPAAPEVQQVPPKEDREQDVAGAKKEQVGPARHDPVLLQELDEVLYRCFKDLPSIGSRNWENAFPPALASMIMRRTSVSRLPRETADGTRKRLAADLMPRFEELPELLRRLQVEKEANPALRRAMSVGRPSVVRDIDPQIVEELAHPLLVKVTEDDHLLRMLRFPGVDGDPAQKQPRTTLIMAWRDARTLHLVGYSFEGCMLGFRRVEIDLDAGDIRTYDAEGDLSSPEELIGALYTPVADALLGPVDEADAWMYERRASRKAREERPRKLAPLPQRAAPAIDPVTVAPAADWTPEPIDFERWESVSRAVQPLTTGMRRRVDTLMACNTVARAAMHALDTDTLQGDDDKARVRRGLTRHLASLAAAGGRVDSLTSPDIPDDIDLMSADDADGMLIISDRALFDHASPGLLSGRPGYRETPLCVLYRLRRDGISAMIVQPTVEGHINLAQWIRLPLKETEEDDDLAWYIRGAIAQVLLDLPWRRNIEPDITSLPASTPAQSAPAGRPSSVRQGPRRIVAQARISPDNMRTAVLVAQAWFDEQAARHGPRLVEDRRDAGQWTIEHESDDRGIRSRWSVSLRLAETTPAALDIVVRTTLATGVRPRLPTLVREIASAVTTHGPDGILHPLPPVVRTRSDLNDLLRHLQSPDRVLPTLLVSMAKDGEIAFQPADLAAQSMGAMNVRIIEDGMTYDLAEALGQEYRTFGGAMRLFQPRFDPDADNPSRHPRLMNDTQGKRSVSDLISRATAQTVTRYDIPDTMSAPLPVTPVVPVVPAAPSPVVQKIERQWPPQPAAAEIQRQAEIAREAAEEEARRAAEPPLPFEEIVEPVGEEPKEENQQQEVVPEAVQAFLAPTRTTVPTAPETPVEIPPALPVAPPSPEVDIDALALKVAGMLAPLQQERDPEPASQPEDSRQLDAMLERRIEMAVASRFAALGVGDLVSAVTALVGRMDGMLAARSVEPAVPMIEPAATTEREEEILRLREELKAERDTSNELLSEADAQRTAVMAEVSALRRALNDQRRRAYVGSGQHAWPSDLSKLADWLEANVLPNVVVTAKAYREMRKVRYTDMERLCRTLQLLDGPYVDMRAGEEGAKERWDEGLKELRLVQKKQTRMGKSIRGGAEYAFEHEGVRWEMDYHIRGIESVFNEHDRLLRIYYAYDKDEGRVLIGHMPTHLTTIDS